MLVSLKGLCYHPHRIFCISMIWSKIKTFIAMPPDICGPCKSFAGKVDESQNRAVSKIETSLKRASQWGEQSLIVFNRKKTQDTKITLLPRTLYGGRWVLWRSRFLTITKGQICARCQSSKWRPISQSFRGLCQVSFNGTITTPNCKLKSLPKPS